MWGSRAPLGACRARRVARSCGLASRGGDANAPRPAPARPAVHRTRDARAHAVRSLALRDGGDVALVAVLRRSPGAGDGCAPRAPRRGDHRLVARDPHASERDDRAPRLHAPHRCRSGAVGRAAGARAARRGACRCWCRGVSADTSTGPTVPSAAAIPPRSVPETTPQPFSPSGG